MEASQAAVGGDGAATNGDGQQQQGAEPGAGPDLGALTQQLEGLSGSHEQMREALAPITEWIGQQQQQQGEGEGDGEQPLDLSFLGDEAALMEPEQLQQQLGSIIQQAVDQRVQAAVSPVQQAQAEARMEQQARDLVAEYPELGERGTAEQVVGLSAEIADQNFPPEVAAVLKNSPAWWRQVFLAGRGVEAANAEGSESPQTARLEGGGGAAPAGGQVDMGDEILKAGGGGRSVLPFG